MDEKNSESYIMLLLSVIIIIFIFASNYQLSGLYNHFSENALNIVWYPSIFAIIIWLVIGLAGFFKKEFGLVLGLLCFPFNVSLIYINIFKGFEDMFQFSNLLTTGLAVSQIIFYVFLFVLILRILGLKSRKSV